MKYYSSKFILAFSACLCLTPMQIEAKKKPKINLSDLKKESAGNDFTKLVKDCKVKKGLFDVYFNEKTGKLYFNIPESALNKTFMLASRIASTSNGQDFVAGQMNITPMVIQFSTDGRNLYMHQVQNLNVVEKNDPITPAFKRNNLNPVLKGFKIEASDKGHMLIDVTKFFATNEQSISPIKDSGPLGKLFGGGKEIKGTFQSDASGISWVKSFEKNIEIESLLSFMTTGLVKTPYSVNVHRSFFVLPDTLMPMRLQDNRVGFFYKNKNIYTSDADRILDQTYINRWRIEPKAEDMEKYFNGELVEPKQQIVFYVDSAFPEKWRGTIKEGIEEWNRAFEAAGFKNVVKALDYPKNDSLFDPDDMRYNCFRYVATPVANAMGPSYTDPRTGEILAADVIWYHNIISLLHNWRFIQTGAVDPRVRHAKFPDDVMRESIKYAASHEVGHTLGLMHNMGASYSFPVEKLRDPAFTQKYGTTPSIMDYARNNYVAQPGDMERGVKLTPPALGVYDIYAINWGYRLIKGDGTPEGERPTLERWIAEKANDPMYEFGAQQIFGTIDPTDQTEDLGNDHIKAGNYGISNLKVLLKNFENWMMEKGQRYDQLEKTYREVTRQYARYVKHVIPYVGGIRYEEIRQGDHKATSKHYIDKERQKEAMLWLVNQARSYDGWLTPKSLIAKLELDMNVNDKLRSQIVSGLINGATLYRIKEGSIYDSKNNYELSDYLNDLMNAVFIAPRGGKLSDAEQKLEAAAIKQMIAASGLEKSDKKSLSLNIYDEFCHELEAPTFPCDYDEQQSTDFIRINMGVATLSKEEVGSLMTGCLQRVLQRFKNYRNIATGTTKDFYNYQILLIQRAFTSK